MRGEGEGIIMSGASYYRLGRVITQIGSDECSSSPVVITVGLCYDPTVMPVEPITACSYYEMAVYDWLSPLVPMMQPALKPCLRRPNL
jgi:hypothetical protein